MTIKEIRLIIRCLAWVRNDLHGHLPHEFKARNVPEVFADQLAAAKALKIPARFADDISARNWEVERAEAMIARWHGLQATSAPLPFGA